MPTPALPSSAERRRQMFLGIGLLLLFAGLFIALGSTPNDAGHLVSYVATVGTSLLCVWIAGILMGRASGIRDPPTGPR